MLCVMADSKSKHQTEAKGEAEANSGELTEQEIEAVTGGAGDVLLERWQRNGIGQTLLSKPSSFNGKLSPSAEDLDDEEQRGRRPRPAGKVVQ
jgi:hypothetical protein